MRTQATLQKWGNSIGLRLNKSLLENTNFKLGDQVVIKTTESGDLMIKKATKIRYTEKELLKDFNAHFARLDELPTLLDSEGDF